MVALASCAKLYEKTMSNVVEVKSRGADVLGLTTQSRGDEIQKTVDHAILIPDTHPMLLPSLEVVPLQLFAYYVALMRGCDIDKPGIWLSRSRWSKKRAAPAVYSAGAAAVSRAYAALPGRRAAACVLKWNLI